jgi:hypothetical protein
LLDEDPMIDVTTIAYLPPGNRPTRRSRVFSNRFKDLEAWSIPSFDVVSRVFFIGRYQ